MIGLLVIILSVGGVLTNQTSSTAWCVTDDKNEVYPASDMKLAARKLSKHYYTREPNCQWRAVTSVIRHEEYDYHNEVHDIAILVANQSFVLSSHVAIACLDWSTQIPATSSSDVLIGAAERRGSVTYYLLPVAAERYCLVDQDTCRAAAVSTYNKFFTADTFCASPASNDTCEDSRGGD